MDSLMEYGQDTCQKRLAKFLRLIEEVRQLKAGDSCLNEIMDGVAFKDTEAALQTAIFNKRY